MTMYGDKEEEYERKSLSEEDISYTLEDEISQYVQREMQTDSEPDFELYPGIAPVDYDFQGERQNPNAVNLIMSTLHLIKGCLGAGLLGMHEAFMYGGVWTSLVATLIVGLMVPYTMLMLVRSAQRMYLRIRLPRLTYPDLVQAAVATGPMKRLRKYSKILRYSVDICLFIEMCGSCCVFQIMIACTLKQVLEEVSPGIRQQNLSLRMYILFTFGPLIVLSMIKSIKCLAPFSLVSDLFLAGCVFVVIFIGLSSAKNINERPVWRSFPGLFKFLGMCIYSAHGICVTMPIENNMKSPKHFATVLAFGMPTVLGFVTAIGFFGYWAFDDSCRTPITIHLSYNVGTQVVQFMVSIMLAITFSIHFWVPFQIFWHYIGRRHKRKRGIWQRFYRAIFVTLISSVSFACPYVSTVMIFLGAVLCVFLGLIFPALIESLVTWRDDKRRRIRWRLCKNILLMILGFGVCFGTIITLTIVYIKELRQK